MSRMSKDRVRFQPALRVGSSYFASCSRAELLCECFGLTLNKAEKIVSRHSSKGDIWIICRPSQFARFMIRRNELGWSNTFKELNAELFTPEESCEQVVDVSKNPATSYLDED